MTVVKRGGEEQPLSGEKILGRLTAMAGREFRFPRTPWCTAAEDATVLEPLGRVDCRSMAEQAVKRAYPRIPTDQVDEICMDLAADRTPEHPHYQLLGGRLAVSRLHRTTPASPLEAWRRLQAGSAANGFSAPLSPAFMEDVEWLARHYPRALEVDHDRDYLIERFGLVTLLNAYLLRLRSRDDPKGAPVERPQHLWLRLAVGMHGRDAAAVRETYALLSLKQGIHATPTRFNLGTRAPQCASCFLLSMTDDSLAGIFDTLKECALISKGSGGIGLSISNVRAKGSPIQSTGGTSNGVVPMLRVFEKTLQYVDQGGGKRPGSGCIYLEPWHPDVMSFVQLRRPIGAEETRVRGLFYALWVCDLFMRRLATKTEWSLFCPTECPGLDLVHGAEFDALYLRYEREGRARATIAPSQIWEALLESQMETGVPYVLYKDAVNRACNQSNLGTIRLSNLCCEITEHTSAEEIAVCNLASIGLPSMVRLAPPLPGGAPRVDPATGMLDRSGNQFDYAQLERVAYTMTVNLNRILDVGCAPLERAQISNQRHRPLGLGVQGLADVFCLLGLDFDSPAAREVNRRIHETLYFGALRASADLAVRDGPYASFEGSPASRGLLQFDLARRPRLAGAAPDAPLARTGDWEPNDARHDWTTLKARIRATGLRNSLLVAHPPTATTSQILGFNECFEPFTSNLYMRSTLSGTFIMLNRHMVADMEALGRWGPQMCQRLLADPTGSVAQELDLPAAFRSRYRTALELGMKSIIDLAADRQAFTCQSQSMNLWKAAPSVHVLTQMHMYAWQRGLKTGMYYLHSMSKASSQQFVAPATQTQIGDAGAKKNGGGSGGSAKQQQQQEPQANEEEHVCLSCSA